MPADIPRELLAVGVVVAREVTGRSAVLVGRRRERGGGLVAVGGGRRGGVVSLRSAGPVLAALRQVGPLREGRAPLLVRATGDKERCHSETCTSPALDSGSKRETENDGLQTETGKEEHSKLCGENSFIAKSN